MQRLSVNYSDFKMETLSPRKFNGYYFPFSYTPSNPNYSPYATILSFVERDPGDELLLISLIRFEYQPKEKIFLSSGEGYYYYYFIDNKLKTTDERFEFLKTVMADENYIECRSNDLPLNFACEVERMLILNQEDQIKTNVANEESVKKDSVEIVLACLARVGRDYKKGFIPDDVSVTSVNNLVKDFIDQFPELLRYREAVTQKSLLAYAQFYGREETVTFLLRELRKGCVSLSAPKEKHADRFQLRP